MALGFSFARDASNSFHDLGNEFRFNLGMNFFIKPCGLRESGQPSKVVNASAYFLGGEVQGLPGGLEMVHGTGVRRGGHYRSG